jgi:pimeloyl-ACP methyl ester carboxylesterase
MKTQHETLVEIAREFEEAAYEHNGTSFSFLVANKSAKKAVVLVHGVTGNKLDMVVVGRQYAKRGYAVYAPDLPGHGSALTIQAANFNDLGDWLRDCIISTKRTPDILLGNSFAAAICYDFAQQGYLADKTHLILACPTPSIAWSSRALRLAGGFLPARLASSIYNSPLGIRTRVQYLLKGGDTSARLWLSESEYHKIPFINPRTSNALSMLLETHNPFASMRLPRAVQERVTVVVGDEDNVMTRTSSHLLKRILPYAQIIFVPHVGHILHFEAYSELGSLHH